MVGGAGVGSQNPLDHNFGSHLSIILSIKRDSTRRILSTVSGTRETRGKCYNHRKETATHLESNVWVPVLVLTLNYHMTMATGLSSLGNGASEDQEIGKGAQSLSCPWGMMEPQEWPVSCVTRAHPPSRHPPLGFCTLGLSSLVSFLWTSPAPSHPHTSH